MKIRIWVWLVSTAAFALTFTLVSAQQNAGQATAGQSADELVREGSAAYQKKDYSLSAKLYQAAIAKGAREAGVYYDAACSLALAGDREQAFAMLRAAIRAGWRDAAHLQRDSDLESLRADARWKTVVAECEAAERDYRQKRSNPNNARFVTDDIARFWKAYDKALAAAPAERAAIFQQDYIDPGSVGLKDFARSGRLNAKRLAMVIEQRPDFFRAIRSLTSGIDKYHGETLAAFRQLKGFYADAQFPDAYFVIGQLSSGGTASNNGLLMGAEMFTRAATTPTTELNDWEKGAIMEAREIPPLVAHEAIHFQQRYPPQNTLLCGCLKEGGADFLGELTSGRLINRMQEVHRWANARERALWEEFQKELDDKPSPRWLYGSGSAERPSDLGYWMGYRIAEAYYRNATDKKRAIRDLLIVTDCKEVLKTSRYAEKFAH